MSNSSISLSVTLNCSPWAWMVGCFQGQYRHFCIWVNLVKLVFLELKFSICSCYKLKFTYEVYSQFKTLLLLPQTKIALAWIVHGKPLASGRLCGRAGKILQVSKAAEVCKMGNLPLFKVLSVKAQKTPSQINFAHFQRSLIDVNTDVFSGSCK